jgi:hypothetical protein
MAIGLPHNFIAVTCTVSHSEVTNWSGLRTWWMNWFLISSALPLRLSGGIPNT